MTTLQSTTQYALLQLERKLTSGDWPAGELLPSERRIAADLNVSRTPLRAALNELTRRGQLKRNEPRGYLVVGGTTGNLQPMAQTIGILSYLDSRDWGTYGYADYTENGVRSAVIQGGSHLMQFQPDAMDLATIQWMKQQRLSGVIASHDLSKNERGINVLQMLHEQGINVVTHGNMPCLAEIDRVICDQDQGMYDLTTWLLNQGCRRILRFWREAATDTYWLNMRDDGYLRAHARMGIEPLEAVVYPDPPMPFALITHEDWEKMARWTIGYLAQPLLDPRGIDAIICVSDGYVEATGRACEILGKDPNQDLKICGFDNFWKQQWFGLGKFKAPAATVSTQPDVIGREMVTLLRERVGHLLPDEPQCRMVPAQLIVTE